MDLDEARAFLQTARRNGTAWQIDNQTTINEAFGVFWDSAPSEDEFCNHMYSLILTPSIIYRMAQVKNG